MGDQPNYLREIGMPRDDEAYQQGAPEFGSRNASIIKRVVNLGTARDNEKLELAGMWLWAIHTTGLNANVDVRFNEQVGQPVNFRRGQVLAGYAFQRLFLTNTVQSGATITFHASQQMLDIRNAVTDVAQFQEVPPDLFTTGQVVLGAALTLISPASQFRRRLVVKAMAANTAPVYITNILGGVGSGFELSPGQEVEIRSLMFDVYGIRGGVAQSICFMEEFNAA